MATPTSEAVARNEPRTRTALLLEAIALRQQIAVPERSRTRRPLSLRKTSSEPEFERLAPVPNVHLGMN